MDLEPINTFTQCTTLGHLFCREIYTLYHYKLHRVKEKTYLIHNSFVFFQLSTNVPGRALQGTNSVKRPPPFHIYPHHRLWLPSRYQHFSTFCTCRLNPGPLFNSPTKSSNCNKKHSPFLKPSALSLFVVQFSFLIFVAALGLQS